MAKSYSQDLRERVIKAVTEEQMSRRAAAKRFGVSESSAVKWLQAYNRENRLCPRGTGGHRPSKTKPERDWLLAVIAADPGITLEALSVRFFSERGVTADTSMLSRFFQSANISFKKKRAAERAG
jgi:transposase